MTDLTDWINERRNIHNAATHLSAEPWESQAEGWAVISSGPDSIFHAYSEEIECPICGAPDQNGEPEIAIEFDTERAIVDAHNTLPALLTAVENVLELHQATETGVGDQYWKEPDYCPMCSEYYPCPTVRAIEGAIR